MGSCHPEVAIHLLHLLYGQYLLRIVSLDRCFPRALRIFVLKIVATVMVLPLLVYKPSHHLRDSLAS